jgi:hypothetical protein
LPIRRARLGHEAKDDLRSSAFSRTISGVSSAKAKKDYGAAAESAAGGGLHVNNELNVEALLHLNVLSLIITIAYLGLDRVHLEKDAFLASLEEAREKALAFVLRFDVSPGKTPAVKSMFYRFPFWIKLKFYVICQVANVHRDITMGRAWRFTHCCHRQRYVPLLNYFYKRRDRLWVSLFATILLILFLYTTAAALWDLQYFPADFWMRLHWIYSESLMTPNYWICIVILLWIFFTIGMTHILQHVGSICDRLQVDIDTHMKEIADDVARNTLNAADNNHPPAA